MVTGRRESDYREPRIWRGPKLTDSVERNWRGDTITPGWLIADIEEIYNLPSYLPQGRIDS